MNIIHISATELKNSVSEILDMVRLRKGVAIIKKYGKPIVKIVPILDANPTIDIKTLIAKSYGSLPDFPNVTRLRKSRKRNPVL